MLDRMMKQSISQCVCQWTNAYVFTFRNPRKRPMPLFSVRPLKV